MLRCLKCKNNLLLLLGAVLIQACSSHHAPQLTLISSSKISYPSGSGVAYRDGKIYIIGDDSPWLYILDTALRVTDSVRLTPDTINRVPWQTKRDYEDIVFTGFRQQGDIMLLGSGSVEKNRSTLMLVNDTLHQVKTYPLDTLYNRFRSLGLKDLNIEGITNLNGNYILSNRGNKGFLKNYMIVLPENFWLHQDSCVIYTLLAGVNKDTAAFNGISGLEYDFASDKLLATVSTENTYSNNADGEIGKSYLWLFYDMQEKKNYRAVNPDIIIDLGKSDNRFTGHKIEAVTILSRSRKQMDLLFVADDDDGYTHLFKARLIFN